MTEMILPSSPDVFPETEYKFTTKNSRIFITGAPLSGKSTVAPLIGSCIEGCGIQNMDILRLTAQMIEETKPANQRSPFIQYGSCDAYKAIGDGSYSDQNLIEGYLKYSEIVTDSLNFILPKLETQGARDMVFEGVQLTPNIVKKFFNQSSRLIVVTSSEQQLKENADKMFKQEEWLLEIYSTHKLLTIQNEILSQTGDFPNDSLLVLDNTQSISKSTANIMNFLINSKAISRK